MQSEVVENEGVESKFWHIFENFAKKVLLNKKVIWSIAVVIIAVLALTISLAVSKEKRRKKVQELYLDAYVKYQQVSETTKGSDKINAERIGIAVEALQKVVATKERFSENYLAYLELGNLYILNKDYKNALKYYKEVEKAGSEFFATGLALLNIAKIYQTQAKYDEAIAYYKKMLSTYSNYLQDVANYHLGLCYEKLGKKDLAISAYKKVRQVSSYAFDAKNNLEIINRLDALKTVKSEKKGK